MAEPLGRGVAGIAADADTMTEAYILFQTPSWVALLEWLEFHGIDPRTIPAGTRISRDECGRCIRYVRIIQDEEGRMRVNRDPSEPFWMTELAVEQGEAPPLPYPSAVAELLRPKITTSEAR